MLARRSWPYALFALLLYFIYRAALRHFYLFDGDHAIQIIMARYFSWESADFYYWGQNRLGSLIPLLLVVPIKLGLPALYSAVVVALAFYSVALILLVHHARGAAERLAAFLAFFLVPIGAYKFLLYTGHPYGPSMALSLGAFTLVFGSWPVRVRMFLAGLLMSVSFWVSEATIASLVPLLWLAFERRKRLRIELLDWCAFFVALSVMVPFIFYWRRQIGFEGHDADYVKPADLEMLWAGLRKFLPQFSDMVESMRPGESRLAFCVGALLALVNPLFLLLRSRWGKESPDGGFTPILSFIAIHDCVYFLIVLFSRHAYFGEGLIQRFWVPVIVYSVYLTLVGTARLVERGFDTPRAGQVLMSGAALVVAVGLAFLTQANWPNRESFQGMKDHWNDLELVRERGATHVTADYWRSLPLNVLSQFEVLAVPRDFSRTARFKDQFNRKARRRDPRAYYDFK